MDGFWLAVNVCIVHQLEKHILKVIQIIFFLCAFIVIALVWILLLFNIREWFLERYLIVLSWSTDMFIFLTAAADILESRVASVRYKMD